MPVGSVKFFNNEKGFGFISPDDGSKDSFVHISAVERAGMGTLAQNQRLRYEVEADQRGRESAVNLEAA
ncbi:MAG TPA: cold-shock protein [Sphingomonas sp.]|nr:cold-shock protein [Sphingomonas sp.]